MTSDHPVTPGTQIRIFVSDPEPLEKALNQWLASNAQVTVHGVDTVALPTGQLAITIWFSGTSK